MYSSAVVAVSIVGTVAADIVHFILDVPLWASTALYAAATAATFWTWYLSEKTLSIHSIVTRRREAFYWAAVFLAFALGTALGDFTALVWHWGFLISGITFVVLIAVPAIARFVFGADAIVTFWFAYVLTRPLGASFADWLGEPREESGLGLGPGWVTLVSTVLIVVSVAYMMGSEKSATVIRLGGAGRLDSGARRS